MGDSQAISRDKKNSKTWPVSNHPQMPKKPLRTTTKCPMWQKTLIFSSERKVVFSFSYLSVNIVLSSVRTEKSICIAARVSKCDCF